MIWKAKDNETIVRFCGSQILRWTGHVDAKSHDQVDGIVEETQRQTEDNWTVVK